MPKLPYNAARDFMPVILVGTSPNILVVNPSVPAKDVAELAALAKSKPGKLTYASSGQGSLQHIAAEMFKSVAGADIVHVPFKGSGQAVSIAESGYPDYDLTSWWGLFAPAGTPPEIIAKVHRDTLAVLRNADVKERFAGLSVDPGGGSSREFADYVRQEIAKYDALVKRLDIKTE